MYKTLKEYRAKQAKEHRAWYKKKAMDKEIRYFPYKTDWAEAAEKMTAVERKFYKVHIGKSHQIKKLIADILAGM